MGDSDVPSECDYRDLGRILIQERVATSPFSLPPAPVCPSSTECPPLGLLLLRKLLLLSDQSLLPLYLGSWGWEWSGGQRGPPRQARVGLQQQ